MAGHSLQERFTVARQAVVEILAHQRRPGQSYQGFVKARARFAAKLMGFWMHLRCEHARWAGPYSSRWGWQAFAVDGSRIETPRTLANEQGLGRCGRKKSGPQFALTTLYHMGTGLPWAWQIGPGWESERVHLRALLAYLPAGALLVADAGFTGYELLCELMTANQAFLIRVGRNVTLLRQLGVEIETRPHEIWLWPQGHRDQPPLKLRLIRLETGKEGVCLVSNVLEEERLSDETAGRLYQMRWGVEVFYRSFKRTLGQYKLLSRSPEQARQELEWALTGYLLLGLMSVAGLIQAGTDPLQASVAQALSTVRRAVRTHHRWRRAGDLRVLLAQARKDDYRRRGAKTARDWPHKKNEPRCGQPKIRAATPKEIALAKGTYQMAS